MNKPKLRITKKHVEDFLKKNEYQITKLRDFDVALECIKRLGNFYSFMDEVEDILSHDFLIVRKASTGKIRLFQFEKSDMFLNSNFHDLSKEDEILHIYRGKYPLEKAQKIHDKIGFSSIEEFFYAVLDEMYIEKMCSQSKFLFEQFFKYIDKKFEIVTNSEEIEKTVTELIQLSSLLRPENAKHLEEIQIEYNSKITNPSIRRKYKNDAITNLKKVKISIELKDVFQLVSDNVGTKLGEEVFQHILLQRPRK
ncbi:MAG: hypothetical protein H6622_13520 [Halobacteriovoraceae bacterium]|nr:hypothetical protein [Halobacteriovoraceae bacterium]